MSRIKSTPTTNRFLYGLRKHFIQSSPVGWRFRHLLCVVIVISHISMSTAAAQDQPTPETPPESADTKAPETPEKVDVNPVAADAEIASRLVRILEATGWFKQPEAHVDGAYKRGQDSFIIESCPFFTPRDSQMGFLHKFHPGLPEEIV